MRRAAVSAVISVPSNAATRALVQALPGLAPENKAALLEVLALRGDAAGISESVNKLAGDDNLVVRQAAIRALGRLGSAASIPVLAATLKEGGTAGADASKSLAELQAEGVTDALIKQAEAGDTAVREAVLKVLAE